MRMHAINVMRREAIPILLFGLALALFCSGYSLKKDGLLVSIVVFLSGIVMLVCGGILLMYGGEL